MPAAPFAFATDRTPENEAKVRRLLEPHANFCQWTDAVTGSTLITRGRNDEIFGPAGAEAYKRDLPDAELHLLDTGRLALEDEFGFIAARIRDLLSRHVV